MNQATTPIPQSLRTARGSRSPWVRRQSRDIWIVDVARGTSTRFTFDPARDDFPVWSPDGKNSRFCLQPDWPREALHQARRNGQEKNGRWAIRLGFPKAGRRTAASCCSPISLRKPAAILVLPNPLPGPGRASPESKATPFLVTQFSEQLAQFSPDGRWVAYQSNSPSAADVFVRPFSPDGNGGAGAKWLVSKGSGIYPRWRADGKQLFYSTISLDFMAVDIDTSKEFQAGTPRSAAGSSADSAGCVPARTRS